MFGYVPFLYASSHFHWFPIICLILRTFTVPEVEIVLAGVGAGGFTVPEVEIV